MPDVTHPDSVDVIVVGAGIGGLHTARRLHEAGRSVAVLERRTRLGGRLRTDELAGAAVDRTDRVGEADGAGRQTSGLGVDEGDRPVAEPARHDVERVAVDALGS